MRLGFVGCGRWSSRLAESFRACGAEIVAHDSRTSAHLSSIHKDPRRCDCGHLWTDHPRAEFETGKCRGLGRWIRGDGPDGGFLTNTNACDSQCERFIRTPLPSGFGGYQPWRDQLTDNSVDAIVAVAPPEVTTEVALACAASGKPCLATKPLLCHPERVKSVFYVDLWRLFSRSHAEAKRYFRETEKAQLDIDFYGSGPIRSFPGALDYGPHVLAAMLDIEPELRIVKADRAKCESGELFGIFAYCPGGKTIGANFGNGATESRRQVRAGKTIYLENGSTIGDEDRDEVMRRFVRAFMNDVTEGFVDSRLLELSRRSTEALSRIREMAT